MKEMKMMIKIVFNRQRKLTLNSCLKVITDPKFDNNRNN